jgi:FixJ family two-component response regulator
MLGELLRGHTNAQIAARAGLAESTIECHVSALFRQLGVHSRAEVPGALESVTSQAAPSLPIPDPGRPSLSPSAER